MHPHASVLARFWAKVDVRGPDDCWIWHGTTADGYGVFWDVANRGRLHYVRAHRYAFATAYGYAPSQANHHCDVPLCCNPRHLYDGSTQDNTADRVRRGRSATGARNGNARLTEDDVRSIRLLLRSGTQGKVLAQRYHVNPKTITLIRRGRTWRHVH
jgi:hypothetical protein